MSVTPLFDHLLNTGEPNIGADAFPLGDGGTPWAIQVVARTGSAGIYALTAAMCAIDADSWAFSPTVGVFPCNYAAKIAANPTGVYDPIEELVYFLWDDTKCHLFNNIIQGDDSAGNQRGGQIRVIAGQASLRTYRVNTNNSFLGNTAVNFTKPSAGTNCVLKVRGQVDAASDLIIDAWVYNIDTDPDMNSPLAEVLAQTYAGTFLWSGKYQGVSMGDNNSATLTSPDITRIVINGLTAQLTLQSGGGTVNIHSTSGQRFIPVYPQTFPGSPVDIDVQSGLPSGAVVNNGLSDLTPDTDTPGWIVIDCTAVTPGTYGLVLRGQNGGETGTVNCDLVVGDVLDRTADRKRAVIHGSSSMASAYSDVNTEADVIYETAPNAWVYTQYLDAFATLCVKNDWLLVPNGGDAKANSGLNLGIANKAHYLAGGAAYYNCYSAGDQPEMDAVIAAYDALWGQYVKNGIHVIFVAHQSPANGTNIAAGNLVAFTPGVSSDTLELETGDAALCEAGDCIYVTSSDGLSLQFAEILSVAAPSVTVQKFLRTDDLPAATRAYWVGDKSKYQWFQTLRTELGARGTEGDPDFIEDATTGARVWWLTRDQIEGGLELHDVWRKFANVDRFHVATAGNPEYGGVIAKAIAWVDIERGSPTLTPNPMALTLGGADDTAVLANSVDGDAAIPGTLADGDFVQTGGVVTVNAATGDVTPAAEGSGAVLYRYTYNATKDPSLVVNVSAAAPTGGGGEQKRKFPFGFRQRI